MIYFENLKKLIEYLYIIHLLPSAYSFILIFSCSSSQSIYKILKGTSLLPPPPFFLSLEIYSPLLFCLTQSTLNCSKSIFVSLSQSLPTFFSLALLQTPSLLSSYLLPSHFFIFDLHFYQSLLTHSLLLTHPNYLPLCLPTPSSLPLFSLSLPHAHPSEG